MEAIHGLVVEEAGGGFCGAVVACEKDAVTLEDRFGRQRLFPLDRGAFLLEGRPVTLTRPKPSPAARGPVRSRSGSRAHPAGPAQVAKASRIYVEGRHDAELIEWSSTWRASITSRMWCRCSHPARSGGSGSWSTTWSPARRNSASRPR